MIFIKVKMILYTPSRATKSGAARCFRTEPQFPELSPLHGASKAICFRSLWNCTRDSGVQVLVSVLLILIVGCSRPLP